MSQRLRENLNELGVLIVLTSNALKLPTSYVEKDFWVTEALRAACQEQHVELSDGSLTSITFTFKGGTSLSWVFGIIERFSEDVDLLAGFPPDLSANARHKVLKSVDNAVRKHLSLTQEQVIVCSSTTGVKRYTSYTYPAAEPDPALKEGVLLELGSRGGTLPSARHEYRSLVAEHAITEIGESESEWEEFASFDVNVLAPERTLFEKLAAIHDAASRNDKTALQTHGRHFYDIYRLVQDSRVRMALTKMETKGKTNLLLILNSKVALPGLPQLFGLQTDMR